MLNEKISSFWTFFLEKFRVTMLFSILFLLAGIYAYNEIPRENEPDVEIPVGMVQTSWPGASAQDIENLITKKIEDEVKGLENLEKYTSSSRANISMVAVEFKVGTDLDKNFQNLRDAIDDAERNLPDSLPNSPQVTEITTSSTPILTLAISGDFSFKTLKRYAEKLQDDIEKISGVKEAQISGLPEEKYHIFIDPLKAKSFGLSVETISQKLKNNHKDIPLGAIFIEGQKMEIRAQGEFENLEDLKDFPILSTPTQKVRLSEIAEIKKEFEIMDIENFISTGKPSQRYVSINVLKSKAKTNILTVISEIENLIKNYREKEIIPKNLKITPIFDGAEEIRTSLDRLLVSGTQTLGIIAIILFLFLGWRESILALLIIPLTLLMGILWLFLFGKTFNFLSLFALVLSLGLLVDNAIIMTEAVSEGIFEKKLSPQKAAEEAIRKFRYPLITGTFTTIFAFLPMMIIISGVSGEYISIIPVTITFVLLTSLVLSLLLLPTFGQKFFEVFPPKKIEVPVIITALKNWYGRKMETILSKKLYVYGILFIAFGLMIFSFSLLPRKQIPVEVFPVKDQSYFTIKFELPAGTKKEETAKIIPEIEKNVLPFFQEKNEKNISWLKNYFFTLGQISPFSPELRKGRGVLLPEEHILGMTVNLVDKDLRNITSSQASDLFKKALKNKLPAFVKVTVSQLKSGPPRGNSAVEVRFTGDNLEHLGLVVKEFKQELQKLKLKNGATLTNLIDDQGSIVPQMTWTFDKEKLAHFGLTPSQIFASLRSSVEGVTVLQISEATEDIDVDLRLDVNQTQVWDNPESLDVLFQIPLQTSQGKFITLGDIASSKIQNKRTILRHRDGTRVITVGADIKGKGTASEFQDDVKIILKNLDLLPSESFSMGGDNEETGRLVKEMGIAMVLAVFLILIILVLQFDSFLQSFVIVSLLPLSLTGVFLGFWISQTPISFPTMIGIVALAGIIVNDAIVLIDQINVKYKLFIKNSQIPLFETKEYFKKLQNEAFVESGKSRMQPIIITSITTILGLLPLTFSDPIWRGLGLAIIYGMTISTILTLLLTPCLIILFQDIWRGIVWLITFKFLRR